MKLLKICQQIELKTGELYKTWSEQDHFPVDLRAIWEKLSIEEEEHSREIQLALNLLSESVVSGSKLDINTLTHSLNQITKLLAESKKTQISEKQALQSAFKLESSLHEAHLIQSLEFTDDSMKKLFSALSSGDKSHYETLKSYLISKGYIKKNN